MTATLEPVTAGPAAPRLVRGALWGVVAQVVPVIGGIVLTPYLVDRLGLARYGLYVLSLTVAAFLRAFDGGLGGSSVRYFAVLLGRGEDATVTRLVRSLCATVAAAGVVVIAAMAVLAPFLIRAFGVTPATRPEGAFLLRCVAALVVIGVLTGIFTSVLMAHQQFRYASLTVTWISVLSFGASIWVVSEGWGLRGLGLVLLGQNVVGLLVVAPVAAKLLSREGTGYVSRAELREFFSFATKIQIQSVAALVTLESDSVIVGLFKGSSSVGLYSTGSTFAYQMKNVAINGLGPIASELGRAYGARGLAAEADYERVQRVWVVGTTGWCATAAASAYVAMVAWLGPRFDTTGVVATMLLVSSMIHLWTGCATAWLQTTGHPGPEATYGVVGIVVNLALTAALIVPFGLIGIAVGTAVGQAFSSLLLLWLIRRSVPFPVRSFLLDVPWVSGLLAAAVTAAVELSLRSHFPTHAPGLLVAGLCALPGLAVFGLRERWVLGALRGRA